MKPLPGWLKLLLFAGGAGLVALVLYATIALVSGKLQILTSLPRLIPAGGQTATNKEKSVASVVKDNQGATATQFTITGIVSEAPAYKNDILWTKVIIDGDPAGTQIPVRLVAPKTSRRLFTYSASFSGPTKESYATAEELARLLKKGDPIQLELLFFTKSAMVPDQKTMFETLDRMVGDSWTMPAGFYLAPNYIGVIR